MSANPRNTCIVASVAVLHLAALWAVQNGMARSAPETTTPAEIQVEISLTDATLAVAPQALPRPARLQTPNAAKAPAAAPLPASMAQPAPPSQVAQAIVPAPPVQTGAPAATPASASAAPGSAGPGSTGSRASDASAAAASQVQLPSSDADYLSNPAPAYPPMSRRLGEQGHVVVRALIGADGVAQKAEVQRSSGFARLDRAAVETALKWRYVPGKRAGVPEAMWFNLPLRFVLE